MNHVLSCRGILFQNQQDYQSAVESFQRAIHFRPSLAGKLFCSLDRITRHYQWQKFNNLQFITASCVVVCVSGENESFRYV